MKERWREYEYTRMPFGKHKGKYLKEIPDQYLEWGILKFQDQALAQMFAVELQRRKPELRKLK